MQVTVELSHMLTSFLKSELPAGLYLPQGKYILSLGESETISYYSQYTLNWEPSQEKIKKAGDIQNLRGSGESIRKSCFWLSDSIIDHANFSEDQQYFLWKR